ncbi:MAG TPA: GAF domain-containing sensor histidine kinase [Bryobacterales bacterium]|nr:GAF domain-containing sensor histidine kinase [Bryobacterales bacterium]
MRAPQTTPVLADAADVLSDQLRVQLERLAAVLEPHLAVVDARFRARLRKLQYDAKQSKALGDITPGAAARIFTANRPAADFFELVEYSGRRLAKLNVPPAGVLRALREYDRVLDPVLILSYPDEYRNLRWAREQLQFTIILTLNNAYYQVREAETEAFYSLFHAELQATSLNDLLERFLQTLMRFCHAEDGRLMLFDGREAAPRPGLAKQLERPRLIERGKDADARILDPELRARYRWFWSVPMLADGRMAGLLQLAFSTEYHWLPRELELLNAALERCLRSAEKARLMEDLARREAQVRELSEHMMQVEEEERRRISRELHDEAGQSLLCIRLKLEMLGKTAPEALRGPIGEIRELAEHTITEVRRTIAALSPAVLEQLGLAAALRQMVARFRTVYPCRVRLHLPRREPLPREAEIALFRLAQECFHNIAKHSEASTVNLSLHSTDGLLRLNVEDDGVGFDVNAALEKRGSFGLMGMRERVALLGGKFEVHSQPHCGVVISVELPIRRAHQKGSAVRLRQSA